MARIRSSHGPPLDKKRRRVFDRDHKITVFDMELGSLEEREYLGPDDNKSSLTNMRQEKDNAIDGETWYTAQHYQSSLGSSLPLLASARAVFIERLVDAFAPLSRLRCGRSDTIRIAARQTTSSPLLDQAFQAVSTGYVGKLMDNPDLASAGTGQYLAVLHLLQAALNDVGRSRSDAVLLTVVLMMVYEVGNLVMIRECALTTPLAERPPHSGEVIGSALSWSPPLN